MRNALFGFIEVTSTSEEQVLQGSTRFYRVLRVLQGSTGSTDSLANRQSPIASRQSRAASRQSPRIAHQRIQCSAVPASRHNVTGRYSGTNALNINRIFT